MPPGERRFLAYPHQPMPGWKRDMRGTHGGEGSGMGFASHAAGAWVGCKQTWPFAFRSVYNRRRAIAWCIADMTTGETDNGEGSGQCDMG